MQLQNTNHDEYARSRWYRRAFRRSDVVDEDARVARNVAGASIAAVVLGAIVGVCLGIVVGAIFETSALAIGLGAVTGALFGMVVAAMVAGRQVITEEAHREGWD